MKRLIILLASSIFLSGCNPFDPLLLETTLPNGYVFSSNGGYEGYIYSNDPSKDEKSAITLRFLALTLKMFTATTKPGAMNLRGKENTLSADTSARTSKPEKAGRDISF